MKVLVLCGSPKGEASTTLRYVRFLALHHPEHEFEEVQVATSLCRYEREPGELEAAMERVREADVVLFAFPLYVLLVHADYKRFVELVNERGLSRAFMGKAALLLATSIHFYDHTALEYMRGVAEDWGMGVAGEFSAGGLDLTRPKEQERWLAFGRLAFRQAASGELLQRQTQPLPPWEYVYRPGSSLEKTEASPLKALILKPLRLRKQTRSPAPPSHCAKIEFHH